MAGSREEGWKWLLQSISVVLLVSAMLSLPAMAEVQKTPILQAGVSQQQVLEPGIVGLDFQVPRHGRECPRIMQVFAGSPAQQAGLQPGDQVIAIDGQPTYGWSRYRLDAAISNIPGKQHRLSVIRGDSYAFQTTLQVVALSQASHTLKALYAYNR